MEKNKSGQGWGAVFFTHPTNSDITSRKSRKFQVQVKVHDQMDGRVRKSRDVAIFKWPTDIRRTSMNNTSNSENLRV